MIFPHLRTRGIRCAPKIWNEQELNLRGRGNSDGERFYLDHFEDNVRDVQALVNVAGALPLKLGAIRGLDGGFHIVLGVTRRCFMHDAIPLSLAALIAVAIIIIGCFYLVSPERILGTFGLKPPASDADTRAWLRPKGIRDIAAGLVVLAMMLTADWRLVGIVVLVEAIIPLGDMSIILGSGGSKSRAFSVHGVTCVVMLVVGLLLIHAI